MEKKEDTITTRSNVHFTSDRPLLLPETQGSHGVLRCIAVTPTVSHDTSSLKTLQEFPSICRLRAAQLRPKPSKGPKDHERDEGHGPGLRREPQESEEESDVESLETPDRHVWEGVWLGGRRKE